MLDGEASSERCLRDDEAAAWFDGGLGSDERARAEAHLTHCETCRWLVAAMTQPSIACDDTTLADETAGETAPPGRATVRGGLAVQVRVGRYAILRELGAGRMGTVYAARDPDLDRDVAIKVVQPRCGGREGQARLLREAQAMARLAHPGVVPVHDVGATRDGVFLAMELVDGHNARDWLAEVRPTWRGALAVLVGAGRGLAAAHAAGIVHRDIKPANILIGREHRARVTDFGLARTARRDSMSSLVETRLEDGDGRDRDAPSDEALTQAGAIVGTPAYMAPEQHQGRPADASADQFSFCVVLYEAVYGERPFAAPDDRAMPAVTGIAAEVVAGRVRAAPAHTPVPTWLRRILLRGLAVAPGDCWPSMTALLDALEDTPRRRRRPLYAAASASTLAALTVAFLAGRAEPAGQESCDRPTALAAGWSPTRRAAAIARIAGLGAYGRSLAPNIDRALGDYVTRWTAGRRDACLARRRGDESDELVDRRVACLERGRAAFAAVIEIASTVGAGDLADGAVAVQSLPDPDACADLDALLGGEPRPPPGLAGPVAQVASQIEQAKIQIVSGQLAAAASTASAAVRGARVLGARHLLAEALLAEGRALMSVQPSPATSRLQSAVQVAAEAGNDAITVEAWARQAYLLGTNEALDHALDGNGLVEAVAARPRTGAFARALLLNTEGGVILARGDRAGARSAFEKALVEARRVTGPGAIELLNVRGNLAMVTDDPARRDELFAEVSAELSRRLGAEHPQTLRQRVTRAMWLPDLARARALLTPACEDLEQFDGTLGAGGVECWSEVGFIARELGDEADAITAATRGAEIQRRTHNGTLVPAGYLALWQGDPRRAAELFIDEAGQLPRTQHEAWWKTAARSRAELGLATARIAGGDTSAARALLERVVADLEQVASSQPAAANERRLARARAELAAVLAMTHGARDEISRLSGAAAAWLRVEGGRPDEIAMLQRQSGVR